MRIGQIGAASYGAQIRRKNRQDSATSAEKSDKKDVKRFVREDTYAGSVPHVKADNIEEVKKRVKSGFYNSESVNEDLTDVFAKIFNRKI